MGVDQCTSLTSPSRQTDGQGCPTQLPDGPMLLNINRGAAFIGSCPEHSGPLAISLYLADDSRF